MNLITLLQQKGHLKNDHNSRKCLRITKKRMAMTTYHDFAGIVKNVDMKWKIVGTKEAKERNNAEIIIRTM